MKLMKTPRGMDLEITGQCNLRCSYCSHFGSDGDVDRDLTTDEWLTFFEELGRHAVLDVCLQGGEPFIREDFKDIVEGIVLNRMRFSILSNGTLITDETAAFLASTGRCDSVQVSIDGSMPGSHDSFRGEGTFHRAVAGLNLLLKHGIAAKVRVTVHRRNVTDLDGIAELLLEDLGLPGFSTNSAVNLGLCRNNADQVQLTVDERSLAMRRLCKLATKYPGRITANAGPLAEARGWFNMELARKKKENGGRVGGYLTGCSGPMARLGVRADGTLVPCVQVPGMELGRINRDRVDEIWLNHPELNRFRRRSSIALTDFDYCRNCEYIDYCTGSCPALIHSGLNDLYHPCPDSCYKRFLEAGGELPDEDLLMHSGA